MTARTRFVVVLEGAAAADAAHARSLKFLLKRLLRSHSLRCVDCVEARQVVVDHRDGVHGRADDGDGGTE